jgi:hypothetical protein
MPLDALTHLFHRFVLVILLLNVNKSCFVLKEKMSCYTGGGGEGFGEMSPNVTRGEGGGGSKKCEKSVTYYLNGPLSFLSKNICFSTERIFLAQNDLFQNIFIQRPKPERS